MWKRFVALNLFVVLSACGSSPPVCGDGTEVEHDGRSYCVYRTATITEEGFRCPASLQFRFDFGGFSACSPSGAEPPLTFEEFVRMVLGIGPGTDAGGGADTGTADLDGGRSSADGSVVTGRFLAVGLDDSIGCVADRDGGLQCWSGGFECAADQSAQSGRPPCSSFGILGSFTAAPPGPYSFIEGGLFYLCGLATDQTVACWGDLGRLAPGSLTPDLPEGMFTTFDCAFGACCGLRPSGELACWGGRTPDRAVVAGVPSGTFITMAVSMDRSYGCAATTDGVPECWGDIVETPPVIQAASGEIAELAIWEDACVRYRSGQVRCGDFDVDSSLRFTQIRVSQGMGCGILDNGALHCWQYERYNPDEPLDVPTGTFSSLANSRLCMCALDASGNARCWNDGDTTPTHCTGPTRTPLAE